MKTVSFIKRFQLLLKRVLKYILRNNTQLLKWIFSDHFCLIAIFQGGFQLKEQRKLTAVKYGEYGKMNNRSFLVLCQKVRDQEWCVSRWIIVLQHPSSIFPCHPLHHFSQMPQNIQVKFFIDHLTSWNTSEMTYF